MLQKMEIHKRQHGNLKNRRYILKNTINEKIETIKKEIEEFAKLCINKEEITKKIN